MSTNDLLPYGLLGLALAFGTMANTYCYPSKVGHGRMVDVLVPVWRRFRHRAARRLVAIKMDESHVPTRFPSGYSMRSTS
jgi:hypothetical protein